MFLFGRFFSSLLLFLSSMCTRRMLSFSPIFIGFICIFFPLFFFFFFFFPSFSVRSRINSVVGIKKITASMKMVAAARLGKQERTTIAARPFAATLQKAFTAPKDINLEGKKQTVALVTSDKGLCGSLNSTLVRPLQLELRTNAANISVACIGVKGRNGLATSFRDNIWFHVAEFGKNPVTFAEVAQVTDLIVNTPERQADVLRLQFNYYLNMVQSRPTDTKFLSKPAFVAQADVLQKYEFEGGLKDEEVMGDLYDFLVAGAVYGAVMENQAAELGMRMSSMENATKNCGEVLAGLRLIYNRQRQVKCFFLGGLLSFFSSFLSILGRSMFEFFFVCQSHHLLILFLCQKAAITTELTEIISGAESLSAD